MDEEEEGYNPNGKEAKNNIDFLPVVPTKKRDGQSDNFMNIDLDVAKFSAPVKRAVQ